MKKIISCLLAAVTAVAAIICFALVAHAEDNPEIWLDPVQCKAGEMVEVYLRIKNAPTVTSGFMQINFDKEQLEFVSAEEAKEATQAGLLVEVNMTYDGDGIGCAFLHPNTISSKYNELDVARIVFRAKKNGTSKINVVIDEVADTADIDITPQVINNEAEVLVDDNVKSLNVVNSITQNSDNTTIIAIVIVVVALVGAVVIVTVVKKKKPVN